MNIYDFIWFIGTFIVVYMVYLFAYILGKKKKYDPNKVPQELVFLIRKYRLDISKINYKKIMNQIGLVCAFDIAFTSAFIFAFIKNIYLAIFLGAIMLIPLIIISFGFLGKYYEKKGLIINGNKKN